MSFFEGNNHNWRRFATESLIDGSTSIPDWNMSASTPKWWIYDIRLCSMSRRPETLAALASSIGILRSENIFFASAFSTGLWLTGYQFPRRKRAKKKKDGWAALFTSEILLVAHQLLGKKDKKDSAAVVVRFRWLCIYRFNWCRKSSKRRTSWFNPRKSHRPSKPANGHCCWKCVFVLCDFF